MTDTPDIRKALAELVAAVDADQSPEWQCKSLHPRVMPALEYARAALAAPGQAPQPVAPTADLVRELLADTREVFSADTLGTPQDVRDVIEYVSSWLTVYLEKRLAARPQAQPTPEQDTP